ncbi:MAG: hypothetical protein JOZ24_05430, partial [Candidatus Eremiobacteraeota bacterium]|nr:hypothetical protein [Candidatus Eremiobacteraeota bacterium]
MNPRFALVFLLSTALAGALAAQPPGAVAARAPAPAKASARPEPGPSASPTATPEPLDKAIPRLESRVKADPTDRAAATELAGDYLQMNRPDLSLPLTQRLLQTGSKTAQVYYFDGLAQNAM